MNLAETYRAHVARLEEGVAWALELCRADAGGDFAGVVFHAGAELAYHADDQHVPFRPTPHFARWAPLAGPGHALLVRPGRPTRLVRVAPRDFWVEPLPPLASACADVFELTEVSAAADLPGALGDVSGCAYVGNDPTCAGALGLPPASVEPPGLMAILDWQRAYKTPYEVECLREAARRAARGHAAVRAGLTAGASERALHFAYLEATGQLEHETPYTNIIGWDRAAAVLHYQAKRAEAPAPGRVLLIDAGATHLGYASDITRTYLRGDDVHPVFQALLEGVAGLQRELVSQVAPGASYVELHEASYRAVCNLLSEYEVLTVGGEEAFERGLGYPFYPHGLGHHLGLQVHDVGGRQQDPSGRLQDPPARYPWLRTTRPLEAGHVVTVEPGLYFISLLLEPYREGEQRRAFNWSLIDALLDCGGIRIEDDVLVTADGREDLTRPHVP